KALLVGLLGCQRDVSGQIRFEFGLLGVRLVKPLHELCVALVQVSISSHLTLLFVAGGSIPTCQHQLPGTAVPESVWQLTRTTIRIAERFQPATLRAAVLSMRGARISQ